MGSSAVNRASLTIAANLSLAGATGLATTTVSLNSAPSCSLGTSASECLTSSILTSTFPNAAVSLLAQGWADSQDDSQLLRYEFGVRSVGAGGRASDSAQQIGGSSSATVLGLPVGNSTLYCCVIDTAGSRTCATTVVTVNPPAADFNAAAALASVNVSALAQAGDQRTLLQAASQMSQIVAAMGGSTTGGNGSSSTVPTAEQRQLVAARSATLISAILSGASLDDPEQRTQAISAIAAIASSAASIVSDDSRQMFADAALKAADSLASGSDSGLTDLATQLCRLLGAALPTGGSIASARSSGRRSLLDTSATAAKGSLQNLLDVARKIGNALGQQAVPGGENEAAGDSGVFVSVGALPTTTSGGSGSVGVTVTAGPATSSSTPSSAPGSLAASSRRALASRRQLAQTTTRTATGARAALVLSGALASGAAGYGLVLSYAPSASVALQQALAASLPSTSTLRGGLTTVGWTSGASPPALDGTSSYVRLQLPAAGYDATRSGTCARYDDTTKSLATDAKPAVFESYDSATGLVTCRVAVVGSYVVVQGAQLAAASVPPASQATSTTDAPPPPSPPTSVPESATLGTDSSSSGSVNAGAIAGAVVGAVVGAILIAAVALVVVRRRRRQHSVTPTAHQPMGPAVVTVEAASVVEPPQLQQQPQSAEGGRRDILEHYLSDKPLSTDVDRELLARQTQGFSGADLSNLINEAAILAAKAGGDHLTQRGLDWAFAKVLIMGLKRKSVKRTLEARKRTAYHEAGHALVALATPGASPIHKATIVPQGHALGMVTQWSTTCTTRRSCPLPGFETDGPSMFAACDSRACRHQARRSAALPDLFARLTSLWSGGEQSSANDAQDGSHSGNDSDHDDCATNPNRPARIQCCMPRTRVTCAPLLPCNVAPLPQRLMELEVFPQRISVTQDVFPGCRVASSFWAKVLAAPVSNNSVALAALLGDSGLPAALAPVARSLGSVLRWYMERWDALIQPWLGQLDCNSTASAAIVRRALQQAVTSPEADRALGATLALLQPAVKDFLTSTSTGAVLTDFMLSTYGFDTSLLTGASTSGGLLSAVQTLKQKTNVTWGDSFAAYSTAASAALAWLGDELVAVNPRISARQVAVDLVRLADKLLRTALAGPTPELLATGAAAAPGHRRRRVLQAGSALTALAGYTNVSISAVFGMSAMQRQAFVDVTNRWVYRV
ncbi:hypothetical protein HXX76_002310 [Chlamydomonas incerta]|uniref:Peptidase M41 domain-containing protein n=1 Tax=Chlamydomonas incerta TaxID=51695 RepID=A0A835S993_CHLIN|nr:hypothetical protein HXX76_002310 [Chlamydomonas incerta]|eukprot:KAG2423083.1 hypothetical protein HXX76_002310 [Chlamydomonas incerta]